MTVYLDEKKKVPYFEQMYEYLRDEIKNGKLSCGEKLPSSRNMARNAGVSRSTVDAAYAQLVAEGYIVAKPKSGYYVANIDKLLNLPPLPHLAPLRVMSEEETYRFDFSPAGADAMNFPDKEWRKLSRECINYDDGFLFKSSEPQGDLGLRQALANYLRQNRGAHVKPENIVIGAGSQYLMMIVLQLLQEHSVIAMENPAYMASYETLCSLKKTVIPISVDDYGMDIEALQQSQANVAYVTPSHQYPLGMVMPVKRRNQLLNWANYESFRYIIEDDYDSEFRYQGKPIPALLSLDSLKKVIYMGSFSKVLSPAVRISFMVLPDPLLRIFQERFKAFPSTVSRLDQSIATKFLQEGYLERHLNRLRNRYKARHDVLMESLRVFGDSIALRGTNAGSYLVLEWKGTGSEETLVALAKARGIRLYPLKDYMIAPYFCMYPTFLMGFAQMKGEQLQEAVTCLYEAWSEHL